jgi:succinate dehydrogenase / fumarate reductase cytochrome b subunit
MKQHINRPVHLDLLKIRQPVTALVSILHRASGVLMVFLIPVLIYGFDLSLRNAESFHQISTLLQSDAVKWLVVIAAWALAHHLFAGVRFLLLDFHIGITKHNARRSAWLVHAGAAIVALLTIGAIL